MCYVVTATYLLLTMFIHERSERLTEARSGFPRVAPPMKLPPRSPQKIRLVTVEGGEEALFFRPSDVSLLFPWVLRRQGDNLTRTATDFSK